MGSEVFVEMLANPHCHLREGEAMEPLIKLAIKGGADLLGPMPNTALGLTTARQVKEYCGLVSPSIQVLPIAMMNEATTYDMLRDWTAAGIKDCKIYPLNRTTRSHNGVAHYGSLLHRVKYCGKLGIKVHLHPEHPCMLIDNRDAEYQFWPIADMFLNEGATIVWEHGTDARCIPLWKQMARTGRFFVTLTAHHLATTETLSFGDVRAACKPTIKTLIDQLGLISLIEEGHSWVVAGLDDAPHPTNAKHVHEDCCACGAYTAPFGLQLYAYALGRMLETKEGIVKFVDFTSRNARRLHGFRPCSRKAILVRKPFRIPNAYEVGSWLVEPFWAGRDIGWTLL
ncbi:MAG: hypothetical protein A3C50_04050 [Candidatus Staskawiczbacteria bacterium RIFCSPHIGHO2_02_FULL_43_16]|uniref:Uncharacterized protein n=1 Tax=Candidatus Staskawiczbacteria bacterium RIFCSPHIGHO2_01_FULL_41_41 TaxID=1802203 RepID=A0A1G2HRR8_9BACT|nr:MAG: hypothetical protein A2822_00335 [Candidatus Staskawiczbacteria bacterium RIFCSPHIGHO2_01_FULL_41_41]OGZ68102.1 MAG: hypothetical protein A3C50_04050 [Candidatus Staskawiczbacteria bacterium RIFCSPHIGHO2_02_FULL_43_16]OGZ74840.1 MAG: hypothetical protein A3A12_03240 [Candidatus Staskawiczbacteria bacterium RIFCSPLOWO2_01_FULL_43_17b]